MGAYQRHDQTHVTYEVCNKHLLRHCDYEHCPTSSHCALHSNTLRSLPTPATVRMHSNVTHDDDYGTAARLLHAAPDVVGDDTSIYDAAHRLTTQDAATSAKQLNHTIQHDMTPEISKIRRNLSSDALLLTAQSNNNKERLATIHRTPQTKRTHHVTLAAVDTVALNNARNEWESNKSLEAASAAKHSLSCLRRQGAPPQPCTCSTGLNAAAELSSFRSAQAT